MKNQEIIICRDITKELSATLSSLDYDKIFILTDEHTRTHCLPLIAGMDALQHAEHICIGVEDIHKNLETLAYVWSQLSSKGGTRHSLLINLGGGMVTDLGGFAAATFKRGIASINIPTTLLAMVDASVGGKTGINFNGLKNEIGAFYPADKVLIDCSFLPTLDLHNICSGYAEMLKHGLISNERHWSELITFDLCDNINYSHLLKLVEQSIQIKEEIVRQDPQEKGIRKILNLGHTVGHAFESLALEREQPILHGYAVAWGMVCELYFSHLRSHFPTDKLRQTIRFIKDHYGRMEFTCSDYERLYEFMCHDKKNTESGKINFSLLSDIGDIRLNETATREEIYDMLDFYSETMG